MYLKKTKSEQIAEQIVMLRAKQITAIRQAKSDEAARAAADQIQKEIEQARARLERAQALEAVYEH